ncbi:MAG: PEP/pyruvate-binding domain-containing protein [Clostridiales bacterium]
MMYYLFSDHQGELSEVGGKCLSLMKLTQEGFNVPEGAVLTVKFFKNWIDELIGEPELRNKLNCSNEFRSISAELKNKALKLSYSKEQKSVLRQILTKLNNCNLYAVRSSSPEEDLAGASFAGGYETILGVTENNIKDAVKKAFMSCLDERIFFYKEQNGFDTAKIRIAVIIQNQIDSEVSGVGFSLNPLNNCYDEAVFNANNGLGESVVSGMVTPDEIIIDKHSGKELKYSIGSKDKVIRLNKKGGTETIELASEERALSPEQVIKLNELISNVEKFYGFPVDIEWAFSENKLYLLQSRPITSYIPLPDEMQTTYGEPKILYLDGSLVKQGITVPMTIMGCNILNLTQKQIFINLMGKDVIKDVKQGLATSRGGRMYVNVSSTAKMQGVKRMARTWDMIDNITAKMMMELDISEYIPKKKPDILKGAIWGAIKNNISTFSLYRKASKDPKKYKAWYQTFEDDYDKWLNELDTFEGTIDVVINEIIHRFVDLLCKMMPMTFAAEMARKKISKMLDKAFSDGNQRMQFIERSLPDNVTIDMGLAMYELSQFDEIKFHNEPELLTMIHNRSCSKLFMNSWDKYMSRFGCRTAMELDVGTKRMSEKPEELINQIKGMAELDKSMNPITIQQNSISEREKQFNELKDVLSGGKLNKLENNYKTLVTLGGKREGLKYWYIRGLATIRQIILKEADTLVKDGKLDESSQVFSLHYEQLLKTPDENRETIQEWINQNEEYYKRLENVNEYPKFIDSRGKILNLPPVNLKEDQIIGQSISPGVVTGKVKILNTPYEKELLPGEIMVTRATDPGWTPLFINASAIILEVGGLLQHGALVAREYGKPCIAGVNNAMNIFEDGQIIRIDATRGIIETNIS